MKHIKMIYNPFLVKINYTYIIQILIVLYQKWKHKRFINDSKNPENLFDFSNLDQNHELLGNQNKNFLSKFKIEKPKNFYVD